MRERIRDKGRLQDILEYAGNALQYVEGISYEDFVADRMRYFAVMKNIEIVGEAAYMLYQVLYCLKLAKGLHH